MSKRNNDEPTKPEQPRPSQRSKYMCPYGNWFCGKGAVYCWQCNADYEKFLEMLGRENQ